MTIEGGPEQRSPATPVLQINVSAFGEQPVGDLEMPPVYGMKKQTASTLILPIDCQVLFAIVAGLAGAAAYLMAASRPAGK